MPRVSGAHQTWAGHGLTTHVPVMSWVATNQTEFQRPYPTGPELHRLGGLAIFSEVHLGTVPPTLALFIPRSDEDCTRLSVR